MMMVVVMVVMMAVVVMVVMMAVVVRFKEPHGEKQTQTCRHVGGGGVEQGSSPPFFSFFMYFVRTCARVRACDGRLSRITVCGLWFAVCGLQKNYLTSYIVTSQQHARALKDILRSAFRRGQPSIYVYRPSGRRLAPIQAPVPVCFETRVVDCVSLCACTAFLLLLSAFLLFSSAFRCLEYAHNMGSGRFQGLAGFVHPHAAAAAAAALALCVCVCVCAIVFVGQTVASMTSISERVVEDFLLDHGKADVILLCDSYDQVCAAKGIERLRECV